MSTRLKAYNRLRANRAERGAAPLFWMGKPVPRPDIYTVPVAMFRDMCAPFNIT